MISSPSNSGKAVVKPFTGPTVRVLIRPQRSGVPQRTSRCVSPVRGEDQGGVRGWLCRPLVRVWSVSTVPNAKSLVPNRNRSSDIRHDCPLSHPLKVPIWNAAYSQDSPRRHNRLFLRDGAVPFVFGSVCNIRKGRGTLAPENVYILPSPTDRHQTPTRDVSLIIVSIPPRR